MSELSHQDTKKIKLLLKSWGVKRTLCKQDPTFVMLPKADMLIDCRGVKEVGLDKNNFKVYPMQIQEHSPRQVTAMVTQITDALRHVKDRRYQKANPLEDPFVICFFCAYGINRSPTTKKVVGKKLFDLGYDVTIETDTHADLLALYGEE